MITCVLPSSGPRPGFACGALQMKQSGTRVAPPRLPLLLAILVAKLEGSSTECAFRAAVFPDADMDRAVAELLDGLLSGVVGGSGILVRSSASSRLRHRNLLCKRGVVSISWRHKIARSTKTVSGGAEDHFNRGRNGSRG